MVPQTRYPLNQCALFKCSSKRRLESLLFLKQGSLKNLQSLYQYYEFEISKKHSAEKRNITAPNCDLKQIQKRILHLLSRIERPSWLYSGERGKSYIDNGKAHLNSKYLLTMDFKLTLFANQFFLIYLYFQSTFVSRPYYTFTPIRMSFVSSGVSIGVKWRM